MKVVKRIISVVLAIVIFLSIIAMTLLEVANQVLSSPENLAYNVIEDEYAGTLYNEVYNDLNGFLSLVVIQTKDFEDVLTEDLIRMEGLKALTVTLTKTFGGETDEYVFESSELLSRIDERLDLYSKEYGIEYEDGAAEDVYKLITEKVTGRLRVISDSYVGIIAPYALKLERVSNFWYLPLLLALVCFAGMIVLELKKLRTALYTAVLPCYLASFTTLAFSFIMLKKDYLANVVLAEGTFKYACHRVYDIAFGYLKNISLMLTVLFLVSAIVIIALIFILPDRKDRHHSQRRRALENEEE